MVWHGTHFIMHLWGLRVESPVFSGGMLWDMLRELKGIYCGGFECARRVSPPNPGVWEVRVRSGWEVTECIPLAPDRGGLQKNKVPFRFSEAYWLPSALSVMLVWL